MSQHHRYRFSQLLSTLHGQFSGYTDYRYGLNQSYRMGDIVMSAYSVFFMQSPSFLSHQSNLQQQKRRNNHASLFGVYSIPSDNVIRDQLDEVKPSEVHRAYEHLFSEFESYELLPRFCSDLGSYLLALDGSWTIRSKKSCCDSCLHKNLSDGTKLYYHSIITPALVVPGGKKVLSLPPEPIVPQDGCEKQDCEINAAKRWLAQWGQKFSPLGMTILGDDLYAHQPFCEAILDQHMNFLLVCKPDSHQTLYEEVALFAEKGLLKSFTFFEGKARKRQRFECRYMEKLPLKDGKDALEVNWLEVTAYDQQGQQTYQNAWITQHPLKEETLPLLVPAGRARWKVENENLNTLKNQGYHITHKFGHGQKYLANTLLMLNILAFLTHTFLELVHRQYQLIRDTLPTRVQFFQDINALTRYMSFKSWDQLFEFMIESLGIDSS